MTSSVQTFCDAMAADLTANVDGLNALTDAQVHLYLPVPEDEGALGGERHLGVWVLGNTAVPLMSETHERTQVYQVSVWEYAAEAGARVAQDTDADIAFIEMAEDVLDRMYLIVNEFLGDTEQTWPMQMGYGASSLMVRRVTIQVSAKTLHAFT